MKGLNLRLNDTGRCFERANFMIEDKQQRELRQKAQKKINDTIEEYKKKMVNPERIFGEFSYLNGQIEDLENKMYNNSLNKIDDDFEDLKIKAILVAWSGINTLLLILLWAGGI